MRPEMPLLVLEVDRNARATPSSSSEIEPCGCWSVPRPRGLLEPEEEAEASKATASPSGSVHQREETQPLQLRSRQLRAFPSSLLCRSHSEPVLKVFREALVAKPNDAAGDGYKLLTGCFR